MRLNNKKYGTRTKHRSRKNLNNVTRCMLWVGCRKWGLKTPDLINLERQQWALFLPVLLDCGTGEQVQHAITVPPGGTHHVL